LIGGRSPCIAAVGLGNVGCIYIYRTTLFGTRVLLSYLVPSAGKPTPSRSSVQTLSLAHAPGPLQPIPSENTTVDRAVATPSRESNSRLTDR
jgi:hypothetical protein